MKKQMKIKKTKSQSVAYYYKSIFNLQIIFIFSEMSELVINQEMKDYMQKLAENKIKSDQFKDELFNPNELKIVNSSVHNGNHYMLDKYGLVIRKKFQNSKKTAFGWRYYNDEPINIHISDLLLQTNSSDIQVITLQQIKHQFPNVFNPPRGIIYKIYSNIFPEIDLNSL